MSEYAGKFRFYFSYGVTVCKYNLIHQILNVFSLVFLVKFSVFLFFHIETTIIIISAVGDTLQRWKSNIVSIMKLK